jgi:exosortase
MSQVENQLPKGRGRKSAAAKKVGANQPIVVSTAANGAVSCGTVSDAAPAPPTWQPGTSLLLAAVALGVGVWSYWPTLKELVSTWEREPDYSHGYLVVPLAMVFLWIRRGSFPGFGPSSPVLGLALLATSLLIRACDAVFFLRFLDGYSLLPWVASIVAILFGRRVLVWALPSIGFLLFMIPIPYSAETALSYPLQRVATKLSCAALQVLGQPAFAEGNVILLAEHQLEVAQACSGLRLFMSVIALAYCYVTLVRRAWWEKLILIAAVGPIAILSNALRIVATGLLYQFSTGEAARKFSHDFAGWAMIPVAAALFAGVLWYLGRLIREEEVLAVSTLVRKLES